MTPETKVKIKKIPKLRFPEFIDAWEEKKLGCIVEFLRGKGISKDDIVNDGKNKCIRYGELYTEYNEVISAVKSKTNISKENSLLSKSGDVLIPSSGETAIDIATSSCLNEDEVLLGGDLNVLRPNKDNDGIFLAYDLSNFQKCKIARIAQGNSVVHLYASQLKLLKINIPQKEEQQKIAEFLGSTDEWIENLREQKKSLEIYKKGMMQKIFSQEIRFKDEKGDDFTEWGEKKLGEIAEIIMGQSPDSKYYNINKIGEYLIQGNADIVNRKIYPRNWTSCSTKICEHGDIIMTVRAPVGYIAKCICKACIGRGVCAIRNKKNSDIDFLYQFLLYFEKRWIKFEQGSTFTAVNTKDIKNLKLSVPSFLEQQKIAEFLISIDNLIESKQQQIIQAEQWKNGLMQGLFV